MGTSTAVTDPADLTDATNRPEVAGPPVAGSPAAASPPVGPDTSGPSTPNSVNEAPDQTSDETVDSELPAPSLVRPYTLTAGRTRSVIYLPLEAPVHTTSPIVPSTWPASDMRARIVTLCIEGPSVAEISARLNLPLGVARVLVGDLVESGTLRVSKTLDDDATADERRELIGRTLRGLRAL